MDSLTIGILGIILLVILLFTGMNIGFVMLSVGFIGFAAVTNLTAAFGLIKTIPFNTAANFSLSVIPLFVLMGQFAFYSGLSKDLYDTCQKWLGRLPGGLAVSTIGACGGFAAICGSSTASAATMGSVCLPEMKRHKYSSKLATATVAAGGTLGILIPPSVGFILYGISSETSIGALFAAGLIPGLLLMAYYMITVVILVKKNPSLGPKGDPYTWREKLIALKDVWGILLLFIVVIGGIFGGLFTPNEGASVGAIGAFLFMVGRKKCTWENFRKALQDTVRTSSMILLIIIGAYVFGYFLTMTKVPQVFAQFVAQLPVPPFVILILILGLYFLMGCIMDSLAMIVLLVPIFLPVVKALGMDTVWFGVLMVMVMETGLITPPVGMNVYILAGMDKQTPMSEIFKGVMPFILALMLAVASVMIFPQIALVLPGILY